MSEAANHYAALGIGPSASAAEVRRAYRDQARQVHPDVNPSPDAARQFAALQSAYEILSDPARRRTYDEAVRGEITPRQPAAQRHTDFTNIAAPRTRRTRAAGHAKQASDPGDPTGFDELYQAFFAPRAAAARKRS